MASTEQAPLQARCNLGEVGNNPCARLSGALKTKDENFGHRRASTLTAIYPMVQMTSATKNILIVDNDLGFIFWLGAALVGAGYRPWPACSLSDAISVANRKPLSRLHLLVVNASLPGVSKLIAHFRRTQAHLRVIALGPQDNTLVGVTAWHSAPDTGDDSAKQELVRAVKHMSGRPGRQNRAA